MRATGSADAAAASVAIDAVCATTISGMAAKFRISPASVIRENSRALTGASASSAHAVATNSAAAAVAALRAKRRTPALR